MGRSVHLPQMRRTWCWTFSVISRPRLAILWELKPLVAFAHLLYVGNYQMTTQILSLPVLPIKNTHLFPNLLMPLSVGRPKSIAAIQAALASESREIIVVTQRDS